MIPEIMLAAVYYGAHDLRLEEIPVPKPGPGELLIQVEAACICGTDLRILQGSHRKYPAGTARVPGHEMSGHIAMLGEDVKGYSVGQAVFVAPNWGCGKCRQCVQGKNNLCSNYGAIGITVNGAFAEYMLVPAQAVSQGNVIALVDQIDPAQAALIEPLACVWHGQNALGIIPGETVLIMGAGPIGILHVKLARLRGAGKIFVSEPEPDRLQKAIQAGADVGVNPTKDSLEVCLQEATGGSGADVIIAATPVPAVMEQATHLAAIGGRINLFGGLPKESAIIHLDTNQVHYKELLVTGTTACSTADCRSAAELVNSGRIELKDLIDHRYALQQIHKAFQMVMERKALKVAVLPNRDKGA